MNNLKVAGEEIFFEHLKMSSKFSEREAEILKPLASVEVVEKEEAHFDTEISEDDVPGEWKLRGQVLTRSPVSYMKKTEFSSLISVKSFPGITPFFILTF